MKKFHIGLLILGLGLLSLGASFLPMMPHPFPILLEPKPLIVSKANPSHSADQKKSPALEDSLAMSYRAQRAMAMSA